MARKILVSLAFAGLVVACGNAARTLPPSKPAPRADVSEELPPLQGRTGLDLLDRRVGDVAVYRFSGSYREEPILVTEEIRAREGGEYVVDYTLNSGEETLQFRVRRGVVGFEIGAVVRLEGEAELPATAAEFEAWMERTAFAADANVGRVSRAKETCLVGEDAHTCMISRYQVMVGEDPATLTVATSAALPGRDVGGTIETESGEVIYRAELVELQRGGLTPTARAAR